MKALKLSAFVLTAALLVTSFNAVGVKAQSLNEIKVYDNGNYSYYGPGVNPGKWCQYKHGSSARAVNISGDAKGWRCRVGGKDHDIIMWGACRKLYGLRYFARAIEPSNPGSWVCQKIRRIKKPSISLPESL